MIHELKIAPQWFEAVKSEKKTFEIRKADRPFEEGDYLLLREWKDEAYTGRELTRKITYVFKGDGSYGLAEGFCILGITNDHMVIRQKTWTRSVDF